MAKILEIRNSTAEFLTFLAENKEDGVQVVYYDETIWATQVAMGELFGVSSKTINEHLTNIFNEGELQKESTIRNFQIVQLEGNRKVNREPILKNKEMSKATIKKLLLSMPKEEIIGMVLEMYDARKEAKEYLEFYANPDEDGKLEEYKKIITEEFYPTKGRQEPKTRFAVCRKAVSDYKKLKPSPDKLADLMLCYVENACHFTYDYGDMWEQYYTSVENNFDKTMAFIAKNNLLEHFKSRLLMCVMWASPCGWGFADTIADIYYEYFQED